MTASLNERVKYLEQREIDIKESHSLSISELSLALQEEAAKEREELLLTVSKLRSENRDLLNEVILYQTCTNGVTC